MAGTDYPVNHPLAKKHWSSVVAKEALKATHAMQFMGGDTNALCQIKSDLSKDSGDRIRHNLRMQLGGAGVGGDDTLEGNEENLEIYYDDVFIDQLRHAVRSRGKMSEQRVPFSVRAEAKDGLVDWWSDRIDTWFFNQLTGYSAQTDVRYTGNQAAIAPDTDHVVIGTATGSTTEGSLSNTTVAKFSLSFIDEAVEKAKTLENALRPIMIGNKRHWCMFLHPAQVTSLRTSTNTGQWLDIQKAAMSGGNVDKNPIFTGALGVYNNVILHESTRIPQVATNVRRAPLCGAQALSMSFGKGYGKGIFTWTEKAFDYGNQLGVSSGCIGGLKKNRFNGSDFGVIVVPSYDVAK